MRFIIGDPDLGKLTRVVAKGPEEALIKYIRFTFPDHLTPEDIEFILEAGGLYVWEDTGIQNFAALIREDNEWE